MRQVPAGLSAGRADRSLRERTLWSIGLTIFVLVCGLYLVSRAVILNGYRNLEGEDAQQNLARALSEIRDSESACRDRRPTFPRGTRCTHT